MLRLSDSQPSLGPLLMGNPASGERRGRQRDWRLRMGRLAFTQAPLTTGAVTTAILDGTCGNLIQIAAAPARSGRSRAATPASR